MWVFESALIDCGKIATCWSQVGILRILLRLESNAYRGWFSCVMILSRDWKSVWPFDQSRDLVAFWQHATDRYSKLDLGWSSHRDCAKLRLPSQFDDGYFQSFSNRSSPSVAKRTRWSQMCTSARPFIPYWSTCVRPGWRAGRLGNGFRGATADIPTVVWPTGSPLFERDRGVGKPDQWKPGPLDMA